MLGLTTARAHDAAHHGRPKRPLRATHLSPNKGLLIVSLTIAPLRVLLADDQPRARQSLRALLSTWGRALEIREASDGQEAVRLAVEFRPQVALLDVRMPKMDGLTAARLIRQSQPSAKIIVLSMYPEHRQEALDAGADAFCDKGSAPDALLALLSQLLPGG